MNKADLVDRLEERLGSKRAALEAVEAVVDVIIREVAAGNKVGITGFGTFERVDRAARTGRNPRTGEAVHIDATAVPKFTPGTNFKVVTAHPDKLPRTGNAGGRASASR
ncbi:MULTISPECIES: HU family DNA-binding protein [Dermacoccus]|uniref:HU family DNA-binding protein n=1 Tax=Dermacoccus abyssi TaxID=322596 RepID=A0ABX5Z9Q9_9MICO|nr:MULTISPECIES: HU family DNA-binding protein [Dermacoccus]MBE7371005.1 HU family DNA-binding protein [Dermacoccus barathri]QEH93642.1 HU family DNA-binding protein [Dermacoccus abyssi]